MNLKFAFYAKAQVWTLVWRFAHTMQIFALFPAHFFIPPTTTSPYPPKSNAIWLSLLHKFSGALELEAICILSFMLPRESAWCIYDAEVATRTPERQMGLFLTFYILYWKLDGAWGMKIEGNKSNIQYLTSRQRERETFHWTSAQWQTRVYFIEQAFHWLITHSISPYTYMQYNE